ncbi:hypothetical protein N0V88_005054 [Collariella sp. IMI 366227]|nr:hypothetical protein N0V88_005054 [Collariella sp. IMI 366227]
MRSAPSSRQPSQERATEGLRLMRKAKHSLQDRVGIEEKHSHTHDGHECQQDHEHNTNRYASFAPQTSGHAKWYVDGASYFWAVSMALESAQKYIYILDWWLSPELYLRRPPSRNEQYRLDRMLRAAAERGVLIYVIVYKEVEAALTLNSIHTKHALEALHPNIKVFRYPDHHPTKSIVTSITEGIQNFSLNTFQLAKASKDVLETLYGTAGDTILYWAHHEKLCLIDGKVAFMGGLDICFGRWDTSSHPIADAHPGDLNRVVFPGQDYNNARIYDFEDVDKWENNKHPVDRTKSSRMGWTDVSLSLSGPITDSLEAHFTQRWNFIMNKKYTTRDIGKYKLLEAPRLHNSAASYILPVGQDMLGGLSHRFGRHVNQFLGYEGQQEHSGPQQTNNGANIQLTRSSCQWSLGINTEHSIANAYIDAIKNARHFVYIENQFFITATSDKQRPVTNKIGRAIVDRIIRAHQNRENFQIVVVMPAVPGFAGDLHAESALGTRAIMEFQYDSINRGGSSIIETLKAAGVSDPHQYINFYNLRSYDRINTSAIMGQAERESGVRYNEARREYDQQHQPYDYERDQHTRRDEYPRGGDHGSGGYQGVVNLQGRRDDGYSQGGYGGDSYGRPAEYGSQGYGRPAEYGRPEQGRPEYGRSEYGRSEYGGSQGYGRPNDYGSQSYGRQASNRDYNSPTSDNQARRYQEAAAQHTDQTWDSVAACYMQDGPELRSIPWTGAPEDEFNAFVMEQLYVHSKLLIADDLLVICGSANLNDRSQLGNHDSEIAVVIQDPTPVSSTMNNQPYTASLFATSLRRQIYRKHLGLLPHQPPDRPDRNWTPVSHDATNHYDWDSHADRLVADPLSHQFIDLWRGTAHRNTEIFSRAFHAVPNDRVRTWEQYEEFFSRHFLLPGEPAEKKAEGYKQGKVDYGHVVREEFQGGVQELKAWLGGVRGNLVEMPLQFLIDVPDLAEDGVALNSLTDELYT